MRLAGKGHKRVHVRLLRTVVLQCLRWRLLLEGFRGVPRQRDRPQGGNEALDAAARQGRKEQYGGGAAASWRHAFLVGACCCSQGGGEVGRRARGGEEGDGQPVLGRPTRPLGLVHLEGRKKEIQEVVQKLSRVNCDGEGMDLASRATESRKQRAAGGLCARRRALLVVLLCSPPCMPYSTRPAPRPYQAGRDSPKA